MSRDDLRNHYWRAGSSSKNTADARAAGVVGTFGMPDETKVMMASSSSSSSSRRGVGVGVGVGGGGGGGAAAARGGDGGACAPPPMRARRARRG
jgi:hypothetical protein